MVDGRMTFAAVWPASTDATAVGIVAVLRDGLTVTVKEFEDIVFSGTPAESLSCISYAYVPNAMFAGVMQLTVLPANAIPEGVAHCEVVAGV
jgi:hypothetical protein